MWLDVSLAGAVLVVSILPLSGVGDSTCHCGGRPVWAYVAVVAESVPLIWRRRWPFTVSLIVGAASVAYGIANLPDPPVPYGALVALYSVAAYASRPLAYLNGAIAVVAVPVAILASRTPTDAADYVNNLLAGTVAWLAGYAAWSRRAVVRSLEAQAEQQRRSGIAEAARAAAEERARIAREMHDVLTHSVALMVVQAEAGPVAAGDRAATNAIFESISHVGRQALSDLRRLLGALRPSDAPPERMPVHGIGELDDLVGKTGRSGLRTHLDVAADIDSVPTPVSLAAYRIVQESLTNVVRHSRGTAASVRLRLVDDALHIDVTNDGPVAAEPSASGSGLVGMRERAVAVGGDLTAGPRQDGGWQVSAVLPVPVRGAPG